LLPPVANQIPGPKTNNASTANTIQKTGRRCDRAARACGGGLLELGTDAGGTIDADCDGLGETETDALGEADGDADGEALCDGLGEGDGFGVAAFVEVGVGDGFAAEIVNVAAAENPVFLSVKVTVTR